MAIHGWEHYDLEKEMAECNIAGLLELFKREAKASSDKAVEYINVMKNLTDEGKKEFEEQFNLLQERKIKIALSIAEHLTETKK
jgi:hypothetical protein